MIIASASTKDTCVNQWDLSSSLQDEKKIDLMSSRKTALLGSTKGVEILHGITASGDRFLFSGHIGGSVGCWKLSTEENKSCDDHDNNDTKNTIEQLWSLTGHTQTARSLTSIRNGTVLVSGSWDCTIRLWDLSSLLQQSSDSHSSVPPVPPPCMHVLTSDRVVAGDSGYISLENDSLNSQEQFYSLSFHGVLQQWNVTKVNGGGDGATVTNIDVNREKADPSFIQALHNVKSHNLIATSFNSVNAHLWDVARGSGGSGPAIELTNGGNKGILSSVASWGDHLVFGGSLDGLLLTWDVRRASEPVMQQVHDGSCFSVRTCNDDSVITGGSDNKIKIWNKAPDSDGLLTVTTEISNCHEGGKGVWATYVFQE